MFPPDPPRKQSGVILTDMTRGIFIKRMVDDLVQHDVTVKLAVKKSGSLTGYVPFIYQSLMLVRDSNVDIMQTEYIPHSSVIPALFKRKNCPLVLKFHGDDARIFPFKNSIFMSVTRAMIRRSDYILTSSEELRSTLISIGAHPEKISAVHTGVDTNFFRPTQKDPLRKDLGLPSDVPIFLFIGRLHPWKGINELISVAGMCSKFRFVFIGPGVIPPHPENCIFLGSKSPKAVRMWYNISDCLVLPSYTEGFPTVIMEAFASGIPTITTDVGGCPELVEQEKTGLLVPARDVPALHDAVQWMGTHPDERIRMGIAARSVAEARFDHTGMVQKLIGIHESLIRK
jgi:glycosyltransferase involved in cell wall biosynthesis